MSGKLNVHVRGSHNSKSCPATAVVGKHTKGTNVTTADGKKADCNNPDPKK